MNWTRAATSSPPAGDTWRRVRVHVGGVTAVGFGADAELLLVLTHSGLGVIDLTTGQTLARASDDDLGLDDYPIWAPGIGPLSNQRIQLAGLWGGGLRTTAPDGWSVYRIAPSWPLEKRGPIYALQSRQSWKTKRRRYYWPRISTRQFELSAFQRAASLLSLRPPSALPQ
jgi:hypothetical protein